MKTFLLALVLLPTFCSIAQQTYVPDDNFEAFLETNNLGNGIVNDDSVTTSNISGLSDLIVSAQGITDITGIEDFTSLTLIIFDGNPVASADLSGNLLLEYASFSSCALSSIDVSQNTLLETLICTANSLASLDVSNNTSLEILRCGNNNLTSLDVTQNVAITELNVNINAIAPLNIAQNTALLSLSCVQCSLSSIDLSQNTSLTSLDCRSNALSALNVTQNIALETLFCRGNSISELNLSANTSLNNLNCSVNALTCLNAANQNTFENPSNPGTYSFVSFGNPNLSCIAVSFPTIASSNYNADATASFDTNCLSALDNNVTQSGTLLMADQDSAEYQWVDCDNNFSVIPGETSQSYTPLVTGNYAVIITVTDACGSATLDTSNCSLVDYTSLDELLFPEKELVKIIDLMGRETAFKSGIPLIFIYSDGTRKRVMEIIQ